MTAAVLRLQLPVPVEGMVLPAVDGDLAAVAVERIEYVFTPGDFGGEAESLSFVGKLVTKTGRPRLGGGVFYRAEPSPDVTREYLGLGRALAVEFAEATVQRFS